MSGEKPEADAAAALHALGEAIMAGLGDSAKRYDIAFGELNVWVKAADIVAATAFLRDDRKCLFRTLIDICGIDYPEREQRFEVVYHFLSMALNTRIRIKIAANESEPVASIVSVFPAAEWFEREAFDMYGILFSGHPDLRRLLTDYGFAGHPMRKDFPLTGHVEVRYDPDQQRVIYEPVKLQQEFRNFDFLSPWEGGPPPMLPGDEKAGKGA